jgi:spore maturation protein A
MLNFIWFGILSVGIVFGLFSGKSDALTGAVISSSNGAIEICIGLAGVMIFWCGLMKVAEKSGMIEYLTKIARPFVRLIFPGIPSNHKANASIVMNVTANLFGLGNAATPLGIKAMEDLQTLNKKKDTASTNMSLFLVLNASALQIVPATIIALRAAAGSKEPACIMVPIWFSSFCAMIVGILMVKIFSGIFNGHN